MNSILVSITDDDSLIVSLLEDFLNKQQGIKIVYTAKSGEEFISKLEHKKPLPQVAIIDFKMEGMNGAEVASYLKEIYPKIKVILLSSHYKLSFMGFMLKTGASAFIPKGISQKQLIDIINDVHYKGIYFLPEQIDVVREQISSKTPKPLITDKESLTKREVEILKLICQQKTAKQMSDELFIAKSTVEGHKSNLLLKTETKNIAGLVIYAIQNHYVSIDDIPLI